MTALTTTNSQLGWRADVSQDWSANAASAKSRVVMALFRMANRCSSGRSGLPSAVDRVIVVGYKVLTTWILGVEIPPGTSIGPGLRLMHPQAITMNNGVVIGARCMIRCSTTLGNVVQADGTDSACPVIGDDVELGANVVVIGPVTIGSGAKVGAGAVVIRDVPAGGVAVGNPARVLER